MRKGLIFMLTKKISIVLNYFFLFLGIIIAFLMLLSTITFSWNPSILYNTIVVTALIFNVIIVIISLKINRYKPWVYITMLLLISTIQYTLWNLNAKTVPGNDYGIILDGANKILNGTFAEESFNKSSYFYFYNYQIGYTVYCALVMKVFGNSLIVLKILEGFYMALTSVVIYKIAVRLFTKDAAAIASILYTLYIPNILGSSVINNQHLSTLLMCLALYYMLKDNAKYEIISGIFLGLTQILRPIAIILIIGFFIIYIHRSIKEKNTNQLLKRYIVFIIAFILTIKCFDAAIVVCRISPRPISNANAKYFKFVLGFKGSGVYDIPTESAVKTQVYFDLKTLNFDYDLYNKECIKVIKNCIKDYRTTINYLKEKMYYFMGDKDNQYEFAISKSNDYIYQLTEIGIIQFSILLIGTIISLALNLIKRNNELDIFCLLFIGFNLVHIFIETQPRYRYEIYVLISILSSQFLGYFSKSVVLTRKLEI